VAAQIESSIRSAAPWLVSKGADKVAVQTLAAAVGTSLGALGTAGRLGANFGTKPTVVLGALDLAGTYAVIKEAIAASQGKCN
jgi:hypothetical protein